MVPVRSGEHRRVPADKEEGNVKQLNQPPDEPFRSVVPRGPCSLFPGPATPGLTFSQFHSPQNPQKLAFFRHFLYIQRTLCPAGRHRFAQNWLPGSRRFRPMQTNDAISLRGSSRFGP